MKTITIQVSEKVIDAIVRRLYAEHIGDAPPPNIVTDFTKNVLRAIEQGQPEIIIRLPSEAAE
jgi:hypothetical protein